jgi:hypothetical protein
MKSRFNPAIFICITAVILAGVVMFYLSWLKAPDILVDFGRELYVPWQLSEGKLLYRDLVYWNGPISPYLNALVFSLFGATVHTLLGFNVFIIIAISVFVFLLFIEDGDWSTPASLISGALAAITFLVLFAFAQYYRIGSYNFAAPYSHELTHGILISLAAIFFLKRYLLKRCALTLVFTAFLVGLSLLTKVEVFVALFSATFMALLLGLWIERPSGKEALKGGVLIVIGFFLPLVLSLIILGQGMALSDAFRGVLGSWYLLAFTDIGSGLFQKRVMGLDDVGFNAWRLLVSVIWYLIILLPLALLNYFLGRDETGGPKKFAPLLAAAVAFAVTWFFVRNLWSEILRPLPLFMALLVIVFFVQLVRVREDKERALRLVGETALVVFALAMLMKMFLKVHAAHYGFALAMPATLVLMKALVVYIPAALKRKGGSILLPFFRLGALGVVSAVIIFHFLIISKAYERKDYKVSSGADTMVAYGPNRYPYGLAVNRTLAEIERSFAPYATFVAFPEGATLNFLSKRENPTGFLNFIPSEVTMFGEEVMLEALKNNPPDYVFKLHMDTTEYGHRFFGVDYGFLMEAWIQENYRPDFLAGYPPLRDKRFGILIMKRKDISAAD